MSDVLYQCRECGKLVSVTRGDPVPHCCSKEMEPLPFCTSAPNPEMARNYEKDEPCDDGTMPKSKK